jgi:hypothetical protein
MVHGHHTMEATVSGRYKTALAMLIAMSSIAATPKTWTLTLMVDFVTTKDWWSATGKPGDHLVTTHHLKAIHIDGYPTARACRDDGASYLTPASNPNKYILSYVCN